MKKLILMLAIAGFLTSSYAQTKMAADIPVVVTKTFTKSHPKVSPVEWSIVGDNYKAAYKVDSKNVAVTYTAKGKIKQTETEITVAALPTLALKYVNENYPNDIVKTAVKVVTVAGKLTYAVNIKGMDLNFDSNGKFLK